VFIPTDVKTTRVDTANGNSTQANRAFAVGSGRGDNDHKTGAEGSAWHARAGTDTYMLKRLRCPIGFLSTAVRAVQGVGRRANASRAREGTPRASFESENGSPNAGRIHAGDS